MSEPTTEQAVIATEHDHLDDLLAVAQGDALELKTCVLCGSPATEYGVAMIDGAGLFTIAWCSQDRCQDDRKITHALTRRVLTQPGART